MFLESLDGYVFRILCDVRQFFVGFGVPPLPSLAQRPSWFPVAHLPRLRLLVQLLLPASMVCAMFVLGTSTDTSASAGSVLLNLPDEMNSDQH